MHDKSWISNYSRCHIVHLLPYIPYGLHVYPNGVNWSLIACTYKKGHVHALFVVLFFLSWLWVYVCLEVIVGRTGRQPNDTVTPASRWKVYAWQVMSQPLLQTPHCTSTTSHFICRCILNWSLIACTHKKGHVHALSVLFFFLSLLWVYACRLL